jgi:hypothetical protein
MEHDVSMIEMDKFMLAFMKYGLVVLFTAFIVSQLIDLEIFTAQYIASNAVIGAFALMLVMGIVAISYVISMIVEDWFEKRQNSKHE